MSAEDQRVLKAPASVKKYAVRPGDTLRSIAEEQMGSSEDVALLALHNRTVGLLFEDEKLYAGSMLEIPVYREPEQVVPTTPEDEEAQTRADG